MTTEVVALHGRARIAQDFPLFTRLGFVCAWLMGGWTAFRGVQLGITNGNLGSDAHAYWLTGQGSGLAYELVPGQRDAFLYSPAFADVISPLTFLPWTVFLWLWIAIELGALIWLLRPLRPRWAIPLALLCVPELVNGNVYLLIAAVAVAGFRYPGAWVFAALTKVLPGMGALWFGIRGEWRPLLQGIVTGLVVVAISYVASPSDWQRWVVFLIENRDGTRDSSVAFVVRCVLGLCLLAFGARKGWPWVMAPVLVLVSPALAPTTATLLIALPRLLDIPATPVVRTSAAI